MRDVLTEAVHHRLAALEMPTKVGESDGLGVARACHTHAEHTATSAQLEDRATFEEIAALQCPSSMQPCAVPCVPVCSNVSLKISGGSAGLVQLPEIIRKAENVSAPYSSLWAFSWAALSAMASASVRGKKTLLAWQAE